MTKVLPNVSHTSNDDKKPIINCHTHIFTGDHVPPYLGKTYLPWPLYYLLHLSLFVRFFRWWYRDVKTIHQLPWYKKLLIVKNRVQRFFAKTGFIAPLISLLLLLQALFILFGWMAVLFPPEQSSVTKWLMLAKQWLTDHYLLMPIAGNFLKIAVVLFVLLFIPWGRRLIFTLFKKIWGFLGSLPGKQTQEMLKRYLNIGRYSFNGKQGYVLGKLENQYPEGSGFVILPMDMEYMEAGAVKKPYRDQMEELAKLKQKPEQTHILHPFVFADPRRMKEEPDYFSYTAANGKVTLTDCFVKSFIEEQQFSGLKIYPALGYYAFDEMLLPLWKYAADNGLPVLTHCIRGTIFYRGRKKDDWNYHPVFKQAMGNGRYDKLLLPEMKNADFSVNFTHPLNYLCLLDEKLLRKLVHTACTKNPASPLKDVFGYTNEITPLFYNLSHLKICFGHFGGDDEWLRYFEQDRYGHSNQFTENPYWGIDFFETKDGKPSPGKEEQLWKYTDWYSIICSMMLQYPNVYADISYILHNTTILPLLKQTLQNHELKKKVLYGTDFYVVRNHKSDKNILAEMMGGLEVEEFDQIARENPVRFLKTLIPEL
jgi:predicted TIM-barrel fold metal-dependent hydrolase